MKKKPRVLFIGPVPPPFSGPELSMQLFLKSELLNNSFHIDFLKTNFRKSNEKKGKFGILMILNFLLFFTKLVWKLLLFRPKVVYYPVTPTQIGWLGRDALTIIISKLLGKKVIIHLRGSHFKLNFQTFSSKSKSIVGYVLKKVDRAIVQANYLKDQFAPHIPQEKTDVLYQAMDIEEFDNSDLIKYTNGKIIVVGHMTKAKGYTDIVKVIPEIALEFPEVRFYFAGNIRQGERGVFFNQFTGEKIGYEDPIALEKEIKESPFAVHYHNLGVITGEEKRQHFLSCHFFLTASYSEGFSRSLLEAMSMGKPLIYTPVGAHREVLTNKKNGLCIEPGNREKLVSAIKTMLTDRDLCQTTGEYNYKQVRTDFTILKIAADFKNIIFNVLAEK